MAWSKFFKAEHLDEENQVAFCTKHDEWMPFEEFHNRHDGVQPIWPVCRSCKKGTKTPKRLAQEVYKRNGRRADLFNVNNKTYAQTSSDKVRCSRGVNCVWFQRDGEVAKLSFHAVAQGWDICTSCDRADRDRAFEEAQNSDEFIEVNGKIVTRQQLT